MFKSVREVLQWELEQQQGRLGNLLDKAVSASDELKEIKKQIKATRIIVNELIETLKS